MFPVGLGDGSGVGVGVGSGDGAGVGSGVGAGLGIGAHAPKSKVNMLRNTIPVTIFTFITRVLSFKISSFTIITK
ncbi:hypothetical protein ACFLTV_02125 [Chloroflexota bacterium]